MSDGTAVIAVFSRHAEADAAIRKLAKSGLDMKHFSVIGRGYHSEEKVVGFYNVGDRMKLWEKTAHSGAAYGPPLRWNPVHDAGRRARDGTRPSCLDGF